ncbi:MAG: T9SS type A sorting domain-containing protein [Bacteroidales bacterium]|nr:T9SS type A sorting domain-containing protein [Bacteroidales bacterium]
MKKLFYLILFGIPLSLFTQNSEYCDSVLIQCCEFNKVDSNTITIWAANHSPYLFDYPSFVLVNLNSDTIAKETVNYYGIGYYYQEHTLSIVKPPDLPFDGTLLLYTGFNDTLWCEFPIYIPDSITSAKEQSKSHDFMVFPNPVQGSFYIEINEDFTSTEYQVSIMNSLGAEVFSEMTTHGRTTVSSKELGIAGLYFIQITDASDNKSEIKKLIVRD